MALHASVAFLSHSAPAMVARGVIGLLFGALMLAWPGISPRVLTGVFGAYAILDGFAALVGAQRAAPRRNARLSAMVLEGLVDLAAGIVVLLAPGVTVRALLYVMAAWGICRGALEIAAAWRMRSVPAGADRAWLFALAGAASLLFGLMLAYYPVAGVLWMAYLFAGYVILFGVLLSWLGLTLRYLWWRSWRASRASFRSS
jgi:uncharacterized membrane protein HdeD (DUF308 family)